MPFEDKNVVVLGISNESPTIIRQFVAAQGVTFPILHDKGGVVRSMYRLSGALSPYPRDFIIDQEGVIRYGATEYYPERMIRVIESLLGISTIIEADEPLAIRLQSAQLWQNQPNPFNSKTKITFELSHEEDVTLTLYNLAGHKLALLWHQHLPAGIHSLIWDGTANGRALPSGVYFYQLATPSGSVTKKLSVVR